MHEKVFLNKGFFFHRSKNQNIAKFRQSAELIRVFGGKVEQFLEQGVNYVLTDVPKNEWPPYGPLKINNNHLNNALQVQQPPSHSSDKQTDLNSTPSTTINHNNNNNWENKTPSNANNNQLYNNNGILEKALRLEVKLMSIEELLVWCSKYISSQSSSDDDEDLRAAIRQIKPPFIKVEDINCHFAPSVKEFTKWPELNLNGNLPIGKSFFCDSLNPINCTPNQSATANHQTTNNIIHFNNSAQLTQQATSLKNTTTTATATHNNTNNQNQNNLPAQQRGVRRRHSVFCEICNLKIAERIEEHIQTQAHKTNTEKLNWTEVCSVIESLPSLSTLNMRRLTNLTPPNGIEHQEFLCLHKVESVSQLFNGLN